MNWPCALCLQTAGFEPAISRLVAIFDSLPVAQLKLSKKWPSGQTHYRESNECSYDFVKNRCFSNGLSSFIMRYFSTKVKILKVNDLLANFYVFQASKYKDLDSLESKLLCLSICGPSDIAHVFYNVIIIVKLKP